MEGERYSPRLHSPLFFFALAHPGGGIAVGRLGGLVPDSLAEVRNLVTIDPMKREAAEILKDALALPTEARAALAGSLLESLDTEVDEDVEADWAAEVTRRVAELDSGAVQTISWAEVRRRLAAR
jgi:putative addiction module component (TIGR02574 family)